MDANTNSFGYGLNDPVGAIARLSEALVLGTACSIDGNMVGCDPRLARLLDYEVAEIVGQPATKFVADSARDTLPERIRTRETAWYELELRARDGRIIPTLVIPTYLMIRDLEVRSSVFLDRSPLQLGEARLASAMSSAVSALSRAIDARDPYTGGHQSRVGRIAVLIAHELEIPNEDCGNLHLGGMLHDIGKIAIPTEILVKPKRLNEGEMALIRMHPLTGFEIIKDVECADEIKQMVRWHHERMDGSGYPDGLKGEGIPLKTRILAVADAIDAISGVRPYHAARTTADAIRILREESHAYDGDAVLAAHSLLARGRLSGIEFEGFRAF